MGTGLLVVGLAVIGCAAALLADIGLAVITVAFGSLALAGGSTR